MPVSQSLPRCQERKTRGKMNQSGWLENFYISVDLAEREEGVWKRRGAEGGETEKKTPSLAYCLFCQMQ